MVDTRGMIGEGIPDKPEQTWWTAYDTIIIPPSTSLQETELFRTSDSNKTAVHRSALITDIAQQKRLWIQGLTATHNLSFALADAEPIASKLHHFEAFSRLKVTVLEKQYDAFPLHTLLPYVRIWDGTSWSFLERKERFFFLPEKIKVPRGGNIQFTFAPASSNYQTPAPATDTPIFYDYGLTNDKGYFIKFDFVGVQERASA